MRYPMLGTPSWWLENAPSLKLFLHHKVGRETDEVELATNFFHHGRWSAHVNIAAVVVDADHFFVDAPMHVTRHVFFGKHMHTGVSKQDVEPVLQNNVVAGLVAKQKLTALKGILFLQLLEYRNERGDAGLSGNELVGTFIGNVAPGIGNQ